MEQMEQDIDVIIVGTGAAGGFGVLQPDHEHPHLVHRRQVGGGRTDDLGDDDVAHLHHRSA